MRIFKAKSSLDCVYSSMRCNLFFHGGSLLFFQLIVNKFIEISELNLIARKWQKNTIKYV